MKHFTLFLFGICFIALSAIAQTPSKSEDTIEILVHFDIQKAAFMTDNNLISFSCQWGDNYYSSNEYITVPPNTKIQYEVNYPGMQRKNGEYMVTEDQTIPITFNEYHTISLNAISNEFTLSSYQLTNMRDNMPLHNSPNGTFYLTDGDYRLAYNFKNEQTGIYYLGNHQTFSVSGNDKNISYETTPDQYYKLDLSILDINKAPFPNVTVKYNNKINTKADQQGKASLMIAKNSLEEHLFEAAPEGYLSSYRFIDVNKDTEKTISFADYKKVSVNIKSKNFTAASKETLEFFFNDQYCDFLKKSAGKGCYEGEYYIPKNTSAYKFWIENEFSTARLLDNTGQIDIDMDQLPTAKIIIKDINGQIIPKEKIDGLKTNILNRETLWINDLEPHVNEEFPIEAGEYFLTASCGFRNISSNDDFYTSKKISIKESSGSNIIELTLDFSKISKVKYEILSNYPKETFPSFGIYTESGVFVTESSDYSSRDHMYLPIGTFKYRLFSDYGEYPMLMERFTVTGDNDMLSFDLSGYYKQNFIIKGATSKTNYDFFIYDKNRQIVTTTKNKDFSSHICLSAGRRI